MIIHTQSLSLPDFINTKVQINEDIKTAIEAVCKTEKLKKGHLLLKEGSLAHRLNYIMHGSVRTFYYHDGKDVTSWIYREGYLTTSWGSFYSRTPSYENMELVEDSTVCSILFEDLQKLYAKYPKMQEFGRIMAEEQIVFLDKFYKGFFFMTAKEKYNLLLSIFPDVTQRVNLGHIASFLGISQETLSRIRKKK
jgi:Cyclic nucleotide-binding domain.